MIRKISWIILNLLCAFWFIRKDEFFTATGHIFIRPLYNVQSTKDEIWTGLAGDFLQVLRPEPVVCLLVTVPNGVLHLHEAGVALRVTVLNRHQASRILSLRHNRIFYSPKKKTFGQSSGSMTCWCGSGSGSADPCFWLMDPDPDPGSGSCYFRHWPSRCQQKNNF